MHTNKMDIETIKRLKAINTEIESLIITLERSVTWIEFPKYLDKLMDGFCISSLKKLNRIEEGIRRCRNYRRNWI